MATAPPTADQEPGLSRSLGFGSALVIGLASVAPAYSLAAVLGLLGDAAGAQAPAVLLVSFVPMLFIATAYSYMNRVDPDCGTTFAWAARALGPVPGWLAGWAILTGGIIVIGLLANTATTYFFFIIGVEAGKGVVTLVSCVVILLMSYLALRGIEISARTQNVLIAAQISTLALFSIWVLYKVWAGDGPDGSVKPELSWFSPFAIDGGGGAVVAGVLIGIFCYWGWDSAVAVTEETEPSDAAGKAAAVATVILLGIYLVLSTAAVAWLGPTRLATFEDETVVNAIADQAFASPLDKIVLLAVFTSALASTQTTVLPSSRTSLSMARKGALPRTFARIHPQFRTPDVSTTTVAVLAVAFYAIFNSVSETFYGAALSALGILICVNYGVNGLACAVHWAGRARDAKTVVGAVVLPAIGTLMFAYVLGRTVYDYTKAGADEAYWLGWQAPLVLCIGLFLLAAAFIVALRLGGGEHERRFFRREAPVKA